MLLWKLPFYKTNPTYILLHFYSSLKFTLDTKKENSMKGLNVIKIVEYFLTLTAYWSLATANRMTTIADNSPVTQFNMET